MRIALYTGSFLALTAAYTWLYQWGMAMLEGDARTLIHSLEVVVQSMTTTGYGQDAPWESTEMTIFMMVIQLTGIACIFVVLALPHDTSERGEASGADHGDLADE